MKKFLSMIVCLLLTIGLAAVVFAAPPDGGPPAGFQKDHGPGPQHMFHSPLNLTQEQIQKMREIRERFEADTHDLRYDIREKRIEMRKLFTDPKTGDAALQAKHRELSGLVMKLMDRKAQMKLEWRKVLTPEQIRMLDRFPFRHFMGRCGHGPHFPFMHPGPDGKP